MKDIEIELDMGKVSIQQLQIFYKAAKDMDDDEAIDLFDTRLSIACALSGAKLVGFISSLEYNVPVKHRYIDQVYVLPKWRKHQVGRRLMGTIVGPSRLHVDSKSWLVNWYKGFGYTDIAYIPDYYDRAVDGIYLERA